MTEHSESPQCSTLKFGPSSVTNRRKGRLIGSHSFHFLQHTLHPVVSLLRLLLPAAAASSSTRVHVSRSGYINRRTLHSSWGFKYREVSSGEPCSHNAGFCLPGSACVLITPIEQSSLCPCNYTGMFVCLCMPLKCADMRLPESSRSSAHHIFTQFVLRREILSGRTLHGGVSGFRSAH